MRPGDEGIAEQRAAQMRAEADARWDHARYQSRRQAQQRAVQWLVAQQLMVPGEPAARTMKRCAEFRQSLATKPKPGPKDWAQRIVQKHASGDPVSMTLLRLANAALGRHPEPVLDHPRPKPVRPDAKDRQAGDVEVAF